MTKNEKRTAITNEIRLIQTFTIKETLFGHRWSKHFS